MGKCLVLLTNYYPYFKGEEYLESEINYLSSEFSKIIIVPTMVNKGMNITRKTPNNVEIININYKHTNINKIKNTLKVYKGIYDRTNLSNIKVKLYQNYFNNRCQNVFELLSNELKEDFSLYSEVVIYSYWLYITAQVGILLKDEINSISDVPVKLISRAHRYDLYENETKFGFLPSRTFLLENLDYVYPCSGDGTNFLVERYPEYSGKIFTRRLGTRYYGDNNIEKNKKFEIVSCSALRPIKRVELIVDALAILEKNNVSYHWTHFGDGEEYSKIEKKALDMLNSERFTLKGFVKNSEVIEYYSKNGVGVFVNVSESEGIPVSIMESMSFGIPSIATDVGGTSEIVLNDLNGKLLDKNFSVDQLATSLREIINLSSSEYEKMRKNSFVMWKDNFSAEKNYLDFSKEISDL